MDNEFTLNGKEICAIVNACSKAGVTRLRLAELHIDFGPVDTVISQPFRIHYPVDSVVPETTLTVSAGSNSTIPQPPTSEEQEDDDIKDLLAVSDPVSWERLNLEGSNG